MKTITTILILILLPAIAFSQTRNATKTKHKLIHKTTLSLFNNYSTGKYYFKEKTGPLISTPKNGRNNMGFSVMKDLYILPDNFFISSGVRLNTSESFVDVRTSLDDFDPNLTFFKYYVRHWQITIPLYIGKTIQFQKGQRHIDVFAGPSFGVAMACYEKQENQGKKSRNDQKYVALSPVGFKDDLGATIFLTTMDVGFRLAPFNSPNLSIGITASYNFNKMPYVNEKGSFHTEDRTEEFSFDFSRKYFNTMFQLNYSFGKRWKKNVL